MATKKFPLVLVLLLCGYILLNSAVDAKGRRHKPKPPKGTRHKPKPSKGSRQNENSDSKACQINMFAYAPVCASDGEVYINMVQLKCFQKDKPGLQRADPSQCKDFAEQKESMRFIAASEPGRADSQRIKKPTKPKKRRGKKGWRLKQVNLCKVTRKYAPTCGSDGIMYGNPSALRCAQRENPDLREVARTYCEKTSEENSSESSSSSESNSVETEVEEDPKIARPCVVPRYRSPTCGSDGKMYGNPHALSCAQKRNPDLRKVDRAFCEKTSEENSNESSSLAENGSRIREVEEPVKETPCITLRNHRPTCGSDGKMYVNPSTLRCAQRKNPDLREVDDAFCEKTSEENSNESSSLAENGSRIREVEEPVKETPCITLRNHRPTCGSDGKMYVNPSTLRCAQRKNPDLREVDDAFCEKTSEENSNESSSLAENGPRKMGVEKRVKGTKCIINKLYRPTCGSDGKMYINPSALQCEQRNNPDLHAVDRSNCPKDKKK